MGASKLPQRDHYEQVEARLRESEQCLRQLAESINEAFWLTDWQTRKVIYVSPGYETIWDATCQSLYDRPRSWADYVHPDDRERVVEAFERDAEQGDYAEEYRIIRSDGSERWIYDRAFPLCDESGRVYRLAGLSEDITERKVTEMVLQGRNKVLELLAAEAPLDEVLTTLVTSTEQVRPRMICSILLLGHNGRRLRLGAAPSLPDFYNQAIDGVEIGPEVGTCGVAAYHGRRVITPDIFREANWKPFRDLARRAGLRACWSEPVFSPSGEVLGTFAQYYRTPASPDALDLRLISTAAQVAGIAIDRKQQQDASAALQEQLLQARKLEAAGQLASGVAHDFNNLLQAISGSIELARKELAADSSASEHLQVADDAVKQGMGVTRALLSLTRDNPVEKKAFDLRAVVEGSAALLQRLLPDSIQVKSTGLQGPPLWVHGDESQVQQVVINLAVNARDAMPRGGQLRIRVLGSDGSDTLPTGGDPGLCLLEVGDTGCGIPQDSREHIFEPFYTTKAVGRGTGLGLAIVQRIVQDHGGDVTFQSAVGDGTVFQVTLPLATEHACPEGEPVAAPTPAGDGRLVLVAEDNDLVREMLHKYVQSLGFRVCTSSDGQAAWDNIRAHRDASLVLLDVDMPKRNGRQCLQDMMDEGIDMPVILMTGKAAVDGLEQIARENTQVLYKPFRPADLNAMIADLTAARGVASRSVTRIP